MCVPDNKMFEKGTKNPVVWSDRIKNPAAAITKKFRGLRTNLQVSDKQNWKYYTASENAMQAEIEFIISFCTLVLYTNIPGGWKKFLIISEHFKLNITGSVFEMKMCANQKCLFCVMHFFLKNKWNVGVVRL